MTALLPVSRNAGKQARRKPMSAPRLYGAIAFACIAAALPFTAVAASPVLLVDTGQPTGAGIGQIACGSCGFGGSFQTQAGKFTLPQASSISSVQVWVQSGSSGGQMAVV